MMFLYEVEIHAIAEPGTRTRTDAAGESSIVSPAEWGSGLAVTPGAHLDELLLVRPSAETLLQGCLDVASDGRQRSLVDLALLELVGNLGCCMGGVP